MDCSSLLNANEMSQMGNPVIWTPFTGHSLAPWVRVWFIGGDFNVSVGNDSMPSGGSRGECDGQSMAEQYAANHAVIKSFQYGCSQGGADGIQVEIIDEQGSEFCNFMFNLFPKNRDKEQVGTAATMAFQFGWITTDCRGNSCTILSKPRKCLATVVDVTFSPGGIIKFSITGTNPASVINEGVNNENTVFKMKLKPAIDEMFAKYNVTPMYLSAVNQYSCGSDSCFTALTGCNIGSGGNDPTSYSKWEFFNNEGCEGKLPGAEGYKTNNKDAVTAAMAWLQEKATKSAPPRGFVIGTCNIASRPPTIIFWESPLPDCRGNAAHMKNVGTYIVNGGQCSSVISFTPQIQWAVSNKGQGGNTGDASAKATTSGEAKYDPHATEECDTSGTGTAERTQITATATDQEGKNAGETTTTAHVANTRANMPWQSKAITADLVIQGNPYFDDPLMLCAGAEVSIIVINPFNLRPSKTIGNCPEWLADPPMNTFLSNKHWLILGVSHEIKEGSYTTTIKVTLLAPGAESDRGTSLGGTGGPPVPGT